MNKSNLMVFVAVVSTLFFINSCSVVDPEEKIQDVPDSSAKILPGINPAFEAISDVAYSTAAQGGYNTLTAGDYTYDAATETITLGVNRVGKSGWYISITGSLTVNNRTAEYTVYTYLPNNAAKVAANEFTTLAVSSVARGTTDSFTAALQAIATQYGFSADELLIAHTSNERSVALSTAMRHLARYFESGQFVLLDGLPVENVTLTEPTTQVEQGALLYDDWTAGKDMTSVTGDTVPPGPIVEDKLIYLRCSSCHGWDQRGKDGGNAYVTRTVERPNSGYYVQADLDNGASKNFEDSAIRNLDTDPYRDATVDQQTEELNIGTPHLETITENDITASPSKTQGITRRAFSFGSRNWVDGSGFSVGNRHPDFNSTDGVNAGSPLPTDTELQSLVAFLNDPDARAGRVFKSIRPNYNPDPAPADPLLQQITYELVDQANPARGEAYYGTWCFRCHGPANTTSTDVGAASVGFTPYLDTLGARSTFLHKARWGSPQSATAVTEMSRAKIGKPSALDVADILSYIDALAAEVDPEGAWHTGIGAVGVGDAQAGKDNYTARCAECHLAGLADTEGDRADLGLNASRLQLRQDLGTLTTNVANTPMQGFTMTQKEINDMNAFLLSDEVQGVQ